MMIYDNILLPMNVRYQVQPPAITARIVQTIIRENLGALNLRIMPVKKTAQIIQAASANAFKT